MKPVQLYEDKIVSFFEYIVERQLIYYRREVLKQPPPWTDDHYLSKYRFCNVYRELDAVTQTVFKYLWNPNLTLEHKLFATIALRGFNSRDFFDKYFHICNPATFDRKTFVETLDATWNKGLWNPAYIVNTSAGWGTVESEKDKRKHVQLSFVLEDLLKDLSEFTTQLSNASTGDEVLSLLQQRLKFVGPFYSYQIALDLSYVGFFSKGLNEDSILYVGPGALEGLCLMVYPDFVVRQNYRYKDVKIVAVDLVESLWKMHYSYIETISLDKGLSWETIAWKQSDFWPRLSLSAIEFSLCEWRKLQYRKEGLGRARIYK